MYTHDMGTEDLSLASLAFTCRIILFSVICIWYEGYFNKHNINNKRITHTVFIQKMKAINKHCVLH